MRLNEILEISWVFLQSKENTKKNLKTSFLSFNGKSFFRSFDWEYFWFYLKEFLSLCPFFSYSNIHIFSNSFSLKEAIGRDKNHFCTLWNFFSKIKENSQSINRKGRLEKSQHLKKKKKDWTLKNFWKIFPNIFLSNDEFFSSSFQNKESNPFQISIKKFWLHFPHVSKNPLQVFFPIIL